MSKNNKQSSNWKEQRRLHAVELKHQGWKQQVDIATTLKVSKGAVSQWTTKAKTDGTEILAARPHTGRPCELTAKEKKMLPDYLWQSLLRKFKEGIIFCS